MKWLTFILFVSLHRATKSPDSGQDKKDKKKIKNAEHTMKSILIWIFHNFLFCKVLTIVYVNIRAA